MIHSIERITPLDGMKQQEGVSASGSEQGVFGSIFASAIENVKQIDAEKTEAEYLLSTGQLDNPAALTIASTKNQIAVELLVQLRNKALDAYSEISRISL